MHFHDFIQIFDEVFKTVNVKVLYTVLLKFAIKRMIMIPPVYCGIVLKKISLVLITETFIVQHSAALYLCNIITYRVKQLYRAPRE